MTREEAIEKLQPQIRAGLNGKYAEAGMAEIQADMCQAKDDLNEARDWAELDGAEELIESLTAEMAVRALMAEAAS